MINIWDFANAKKVKITDVDGNEFSGNIMAIFDKDETYEEEDSIDIQVDKNTIIGFFPSEIKNIKVIE